MPELTLTPTADGYEATYTWVTLRFLLSDGRVVDVRAIWDDSNLRGALVKATGAERIEGVAVVSEPPKKVVAKKR